MKRYIRLESVGTALDRYTLDIMPILDNEKISYSERKKFDDIINPDWYNDMSKEDRRSLLNAIEAHHTIAQRAYHTLDKLTQDELTQDGVPQTCGITPILEKLPRKELVDLAKKVRENGGVSHAGHFVDLRKSNEYIITYLLWNIDSLKDEFKNLIS